MIRMLSVDKIGVIKSIIIEDTDGLGRTHLAKIIYVRKFLNNYKMRQTKCNRRKRKIRENALWHS